MVATETKIQQYARYKDSGVEWLGEIPEHWELRRIKYLFKEINVRSENGDEDLLSVSQYTGVTNKSDKVEKGGMLTNAATLEGYKKVAKGDLVSNIMLAWNGSLGFSPFDGITSPAYSIYRILESNYNHYYHYLLRTELYKAEFKRNSSGVIESRLRLYTDDFFRINAILPPKEEQTAIAHFLDDKTKKIDQAIAIKEQQIGLLKDRKQILIHKAVTQGLNLNVTMKDSGVEWIGEIPVEWEVKKLFGLSYFVRGNSSFSKDELLSNGEYVALQYGKTYKVNKVDEKYNFYINDEFYKDTQIVNYGDTIVISTSETIEDLGHSAYYNRHDLGLIGGEQILLNPKKEKINGHYLYFYSKVFLKELRKYATGIKVFRFNINDLKTIYLAVPPLSEQKEISDYIEKGCQKIETAIGLKQQEIEKLKEYKGSLINSCVTGKIKVC